MLSLGLSLSNVALRGAGAGGVTVRNLFTFSEAFDNAAWTKTRIAVTADAATDPLGGTTADKTVTNAANFDGCVSQTKALPAGSATLSVYAKSAERTFLALREYNNAGAASGTYFNLATGAVGTKSVRHTAAITDAGNGWWRCSITFTADAVARPFEIYNSADDGNSASATTTDGIYLWGAQLEAGTLTAYQAT